VADKRDDDGDGDGRGSGRGGGDGHGCLAFRRSELVALNVEDLEETPEGIGLVLQSELER
jgi:hypothetical protein